MAALLRRPWTSTGQAGQNACCIFRRCIRKSACRSPLNHTAWEQQLVVWSHPLSRPLQHQWRQGSCQLGEISAQSRGDAPADDDEETLAGGSRSDDPGSLKSSLVSARFLLRQPKLPSSIAWGRVTAASKERLPVGAVRGTLPC
jgi:hypothetical protein